MISHIIIIVKRLDWNEAKNTRLKIDRGIGFEEIQSTLEEGNLLGNIAHPNQKKYPGQRIFAVALNGYAFLVPFIEDEDKIFLKTIYPSRKFTKIYISRR